MPTAISALPAHTPPVSHAETLPLVQGGTTVQASAGDVRGRARLLSGFSSTSHYAAPAGSLPGLVGGFSTFVLGRFRRVPTADEMIFSSAEVFLGSGGWALGVNADRFRFHLSQASDGALLGNFVAAEHTILKRLGRLFLLGMAYNGTTSLCTANGENTTFSHSPSGGYQPSAVGVAPYIGRNANGGSPQPASSVEVVAAGYTSAVLTLADFADLWLACNDAPEGFDLGSLVPSSWWSLDGLTNPPATMTDQGAGGVTFTRAGSGLTLARALPRFG